MATAAAMAALRATVLGNCGGGISNEDCGVEEVDDGDSCCNGCTEGNGVGWLWWQQQQWQWLP
jgi:hypothetical protein